LGSASEIPALAAELERKLEVADSQLFLYARDLKQAVDTERAKARELAAANERLRILDRLKTNFLAFISHELRTPLSAMSVVNEFSWCTDNKQQAELVGIIQRGYNRLQEFIAKGIEYFDWLSVGRVPGAQAVALDAVVRCVSGLVPGLEEPGVDFRISTAGEAFFVQGDDANLSKVIMMLLENALKFSPGEKSISVKLSTAAGRVVLTIKDQGSGFPPEIAQEIFKPFTIGDVAHHSQGTGLSLALAKAIVEAHGGCLSAESQGPGRGATFIVSLPNALAGGETSKEQTKASQAGEDDCRGEPA
jgi:signal transduction histidine kinase